MLILPPDELQYKCKKTSIAHLNYLNNYLRDLNKEQSPSWVFKINKNILKKAINEIWLHNSKNIIAHNILVLPFQKANLLCILGLLHSLHQILENSWQKCAITCLHHISQINYLIGDLLPCWFPYQIESTFIRAHIEKLEKKINQPLNSLVSLQPLAINLCSYSSSIYLANYLPKVNYINFYNVRSHGEFSQLFYH